ncbi:hypothetical protein KL943_004022 [Ogataea angusta]|nr:hypothetical protein KL943_004022 [Ogataea angusta]
MEFCEFVTSDMGCLQPVANWGGTPAGHDSYIQLDGISAEHDRPVRSPDTHIRARQSFLVSVPGQFTQPQINKIIGIFDIFNKSHIINYKVS